MSMQILDPYLLRRLCRTFLKTKDVLTLINITTKNDKIKKKHFFVLEIAYQNAFESSNENVLILKVYECFSKTDIIQLIWVSPFYVNVIFYKSNTCVIQSEPQNFRKIFGS